MHNKLLRNLTFVFILVCASGCSYMEQIETAQATADNALAEAKTALAKANNAHSLASEASYEATQGKKSAAAALECCNDNAGKLDRMFEKAMMK